MKPNPKNFCGGNYQDWIEVMLTPKCNGSCTWCVENDGYHPKEEVSWRVLVDRIWKVGKKNVILLGGEPSLYEDLDLLVHRLKSQGFNVYLTTNGSRTTRLTKEVYGLTGLNISIHHYDMERNRDIVGIKLNKALLKANIKHLYWRDNTITRFNCTLVKGQIDSVEEIEKYVEFAKQMGASSVRFAELKHDDSFVNLYELFGDKYGLTNDPFKDGCSTDAIIKGIPINFRQMCGIQTPFRKLHDNIEMPGHTKSVLYYNGEVYDGWQTKDKEIEDMAKKLSVKEILSRVKSGRMTLETAEKLIKKRQQEFAETVVERVPSFAEREDLSGHCRY